MSPTVRLFLCKLHPKSGKHTYGVGEASRMDFYADLVCEHAQDLLAHSVTHLACDGDFSKDKFVSLVTQAGLHMVGKISKDSDLRYLFMARIPKDGAERSSSMARSTW